jgi:hypothetical protein
MVAMFMSEPAALNDRFKKYSCYLYMKRTRRLKILNLAVIIRNYLINIYLILSRFANIPEFPTKRPCKRIFETYLIKVIHTNVNALATQAIR